MRNRRFYLPAIQILEQRNAPALMLAMSTATLPYAAQSPAVPIAADLELTDPQSDPSDEFVATIVLNNMATEPCVGCGLTTADNLEEFIAEEKTRILQRVSDVNEYHVPTAAEQSAFACLAHELANGNLAEAQATATGLNFEIVEIDDSDGNDPNSTNNVYYALRDTTAEPRGWGTYIVNPTATTDALVEVPHPLHDANTWQIGSEVFRRSGARGFLLAGAHRHVNGTPAGDKYGEADVAHRRNSIFHQVHLAWSGSRAANTAWQIHGFDLQNHVGNEANKMPEGTAAVLSGGNKLISDEIVQLDSRLDAMLADEFSDEQPPRSYAFHENDPRGDVVNKNGNVVEPGTRFSNLGATLNVQQQDSRRRGGEFVHAELEKIIRDVASRRSLAATEIAESILAENRQDRLVFADTTNVAGNWNPINATLTLTVAPGKLATLAEFQQALRSVFYVNASDVANDASRRVELTVGDGNDSVTATREIAVHVTPPNGIVGRHVFYNHSAFDELDPGLAPSDDMAIDFSKRPLLPGLPASDEAITSYMRGINGIAIDMQCRDSLNEVTVADFDFHVGNDSNVDNWTAAAPADFTIRDLGGGVERFSFTWPDGEIAGQWIEVRMKANANTGLVNDEVFYFGNAPGESTGGAGSAVNGSDFAAVRLNTSSALDFVDVSNRFDHNRDGRVDAIDLLIVRDFATEIDDQLIAFSSPAMKAAHLAHEAAELERLLAIDRRAGRDRWQESDIDSSAWGNDQLFNDSTDALLASYVRV